MLRRGQEQKTTMEKELRLLLPIWCRGKTTMHLVIRRRRRRSKRTTQSQIKQPLLRRKRTKKVVALFARAMSTGKCMPRPQIQARRESCNHGC
jgi:hypothetical protein